VGGDSPEPAAAHTEERLANNAVFVSQFSDAGLPLDRIRELLSATRRSDQ